MAKRKDVPQDAGSQPCAGGAGSPDRSVPDGDGDMMNVDAPRLVPAQTEAGTARDARDSGGGLDDVHPQRTDVVTVSFEEAAGEASYREAPTGSDAAGAYQRARRFIPLAAAVAIAAAVGAITGTLATMGRSDPPADPAIAAIHDDSRALKAAIAKVGADVAALKANVENSARSTTAQFSRLSERLERTDRAQVDAAGKVAKLAETLERRTADPVTTGSVTAPSPSAARPPSAPLVEGWSLHSVNNGAAIIQGRIGLVQVEPGDSLPGLGRIETIRRQDGRWVVVTSRGLIVPR